MGKRSDCCSEKETIAMSQARSSREEIVRRGEKLYDQRLRAEVETEENIGKILVMDVESGEYAIDDTMISAADRVKANHPDAILYTLRIGYDAVYGFGTEPRLVKR
jgi:hypothetical protein